MILFEQRLMITDALGSEWVFMLDRETDIPVVTYDKRYEYPGGRGTMKYVYYVYRDELFADLFAKLSDESRFKYRDEA